MPMTMMLGRGPNLLTAAIGGRPAVDAGEVELLAARDAREAVAAGSLSTEDCGLRHLPPASLRIAGCGETASLIAQRLEASPGRVWLHLDYDVLDEAAFPAVDYRMPGGLSADECVELIAPFLVSKALIGLSLACYNPELDDQERSGAKLAVNILRRGFAG
jgi:arginase